MAGLFDISALIIQGINFLVVVFVLRKFLFIPYIKMLDEETQKRLDMEMKMRDAESILEAARQEAEQARMLAQKDGAAIRSQSETNAKTEAAAILARAQSDAAGIVAQAQLDVANERRSLERELATRVVAVAVDLNTKAFGQANAHQDFVKNLAAHATL